MYKTKAVCEEADQKVEGDEEEHIEKDKRAGHAKLQAFWSDLKGGHRSKKTSIPRLKCISGKSLHAEVLEELAKNLEYLGK